MSCNHQLDDDDSYQQLQLSTNELDDNDNTNCSSGENVAKQSKNDDDNTLGGGFKRFLFSPQTLGKVPIVNQLVIITFFLLFFGFESIHQFTRASCRHLTVFRCLQRSSFLRDSGRAYLGVLQHRHASLGTQPLVWENKNGRMVMDSVMLWFLNWLSWKIRLFRSQHDHLDWAEYNAKVWDFQVWIHLPSKKPCWSQQWMQIW